METLKKQRGVALPIALIMLVVMLFSGIYLMRASNNATLMSSSLAYERDISRRADYGLSTGYNWLSTTANDAATKGYLNNDQTTQTIPPRDYGYLSSYDPTMSYRDAGFWTNSRTVLDPSGNPVEYVIHRMCQFSNLSYNGGWPPPNGPTPQVCVQTTSVSQVSATGVAAGTSLSADSESFLMLPQIHYVITARVPGVKGASVINQLVVMIGA